MIYKILHRKLNIELRIVRALYVPMLAIIH